jgi:DNA replication protein DnaC
MTTPDETDQPFAPLPDQAPVPLAMANDIERWKARQKSDEPKRAFSPKADDDWLAEFRRKPTAQEIAEDEARLAARRAELADLERARARKEWEAVTPELLRETNWADPRLAPHRSAIARIRSWKRGARGIYAVGRSGRGKSRAIYDLARRLSVDELVPVRYLLQTEVTRDINRDGLNGFLEKMDAIRRAPVIVWDDFGKFAAIGSRRDLLVSEIEAMIDFRFTHGLPLLISSNAKDNDLVEIFGAMRGEPILRRIGEGCEVVDFGW